MFYQNFNIDRLFEKKDHLIKRLNLTDDQKEKLISFFNKYPNFESKIDWNNRNLKWEDFSDLLANEGKSNSQVKKRGIEGLIEGTDYNIAFEDENQIMYEILTHRASRAIASDKVGNSTTGKWCISMNDPVYWNNYTKSGKEFYFIIRKSLFHFMPEFNKVALCVIGKKALPKISGVQWAKEYYNPHIAASVRAWNAEDRFTDLTALPKEERTLAIGLLKRTERECQEIIDNAVGKKLPLEQRIKDALTGGPKMNFGTRQCMYHFNHPTKRSLYVQVLKALKQNGPMKKHDILLGLDIRPTSYASVGHFRNVGPEGTNGEYAGVFSAMRQAKLIDYNPKTRKIELGENAELFMDYHKELFK